jgi:CubicO group peptidase (beta-lactamase class C family)
MLIVVPAERRSARLAAVAFSTAIVALIAGCASPELPQGRTPGAASVTAPDKTLLAVEKKASLSDELLERLTSTELPGCSAAIAVRGDLVWAGARGLADLSSATPLTTSTRFDIASISKQFTATAVLLLQRDGLLSLSDPVSQYIAGLPRWANETTLDSLVHHTARLPDYWIELDREGIGFREAADQAITLAAIARERDREPGEGYFYSNSHYVLLATVVENVSGQSLPDFLQARVFEPLALDMALAPTLLGPDIATSYEVDLSIQQGAWSAYGHTGIITTPTALALWGDEYRDGTIVGDDYATGAISDNDGARYGAGIYLNDDGTLSHSGRWGGYLSNFRVSVDREVVMAVACNGRAAPRGDLANGLWELWATPAAPIGPLAPVETPATIDPSATPSP